MNRTGRTRRAGGWTAWASRFASRFNRRARAFGVALLLHERSSRASVRITERQLRPILQVFRRFHWSIAESTVAHVSQVFAKQVSVGSHARGAMEGGARRETAVVRRAGSPTGARARTHTLMKVVGSTRWEVRTLLERQFVGRQESLSFRTSERLVHRSERVEQVGVLERRTTLRRDPVAAMKSAVESMPLAKVRTREDGWRALSEPPPPQAAMGAINVDQLAEQVIRQIDHRVIARRERMGRT